MATNLTDAIRNSIQRGTGYAVNPETGQLQQAYAKYGPQPVDVRTQYDDNGNLVQVPIYDDNAAPDYYDYSFDPTGRQSLAGWAPGYYNKSNDFFSKAGDALSDVGDVALGTAGFGVGGASGASAATGNGVTKETLAADAAGLAAGVGLSSALPSMGLSTPAATGAAGATGTGSIGAAAGGDVLMPAAIPESATALGEMGLVETAPGVWELPAAAGAGGAAGASAGTAAGSSNASAASATPAAATPAAATLGDKILDAGTTAAVIGGTTAALGGLDTPSVGDSGQAAIDDENRKNGLRDRINRLYGIGDPDAEAAMKAEQDRVAKSTRDYYTDQLGRTFSMNERANRFRLARQSLLGGSADIDTNAELQQDRDLATTRIDEAARRAAQSLQGQREDERLKAIQLVNSGEGDSAVVSAQRGIGNALANVEAAEKPNLFSDLFATGANAVTASNQNAALAAMLGRYNQQLAAFTRPSRGSAGAVTPG